MATIGTLPIGAVEESELERRLRHSLIRWAETTEGASVEKVAGGPGQQPDLELRIPSVSGRTLRYRVREQVDLATEPPTRPDFLIERLDAPGPEIAVYSDGYAYHAHPARQATLRADARKRHAVRASGRWVWSMDYADVAAFHAALTAPVARHPPDWPLLTGQRLAAAQRVQHERGGVLPLQRTGHNPLRQLLAYLADPDPAAWRRLARSATAGAVAGTEGGPPSFSSTTRQGVRLDASLDMTEPNAEQWTVRLVLDDSEGAMHEPEHRDRWRDWLHWGNLLQFLVGDGCQALITVAGEEAGMADDLHALAVAPAPVVSGDGLPPEAEDELELVDAALRELLRDALLAGAPLFVAGYELDDGSQLEAAWPDARVAVLLDDEPAPTGWTARPPDAWAPDELAMAANGGM